MRIKKVKNIVDPTSVLPMMIDVMTRISLSSLSAREAIALGVDFNLWLTANTRLSRMKVEEAQRELEEETFDLQEQWQRAKTPERE